MRNLLKVTVKISLGASKMTKYLARRGRQGKIVKQRNT